MSIKQYFNYFIENFIIAHKRLVEFKVNLFNVLFVHIMQIFGFLIFGFVLISNFGDIIGWKIEDYMVFITISTIGYYFFAHNFIAFKYLHKKIVNGELNMFLFRPLNPLLQYILKTDFSVNVFILNSILYLSILEFYFDYEILKIIIIIPLLIFIGIVNLIVYFLLESVSFFSLELGRTLRLFIEGTIDRKFLFFYPANFFENSIYLMIVSIFPFAMYSLLIMPLLQGKENLYLETQITILLVILIFGTMALHFMWKKGLEKYEAYG